MKLLFLQILLATSTISYGQFHFLGDARPMDKNCIVLTPDMPYREGIAYSTTRLNLDQDFQIEFDIFLGEKNEDGADGITFVIHNDARAFNAFGTFGECMGYGRWVADVPYGTFIAPSIAVDLTRITILIRMIQSVIMSPTWKTAAVPIKRIIMLKINPTISKTDICTASFSFGMQLQKI